MTDIIEIKAALAVTDAGEITGTAWPFGTPDRVGDVIEKGAFTGPATLPMLWAHDHAQVIGVWSEIAETPAGLSVKGRLLVDDLERAREVRAMVRAGAVSGLSIGFVTKDATRGAKGRTIKALELHEISIVAVPAHPGAQITSLKSSPQSPEEKMTENTAIEPQADPLEVKTAEAVDVKEFAAIKAKLAELETKAARPSVIITGPHNPVMDAAEVKAFSDYLRTGNRTEVKTLSYGASTGAILAPESVSAGIIEKLAEISPLRGLASVIQMGGPLLQLPRLVDEVTPAYVTETGTRTPSEPSFEQIAIQPHEMAVIVPVTRTLLEDAQVDLNAYLGDHIARRFGQLEAQWMITGNGTTAAEGVMTSTEVDTLEVEALTADALIDVFYAIKSEYARNGAWLMNRATMATVRKLKDSDGSYLWQGGIAAEQPATLLGRPVYEAPDMALAAAGTSPIAFGDFAAGYVIADRVGFEILRDDYTAASAGIVRLHARRRVGGRVILGEAIHKLSIAA
ncbi:phage major capsid protein [Paracoccus marcusii]|uniref:phage major capsid protein n=1 Tax=Paracoccus marcusii TaxID=59779 RepID=UPI0032630AEB